MIRISNEKKIMELRSRYDVNHVSTILDGISRGQQTTLDEQDDYYGNSPPENEKMQDVHENTGSVNKNGSEILP